MSDRHLRTTVATVVAGMLMLLAGCAEGGGDITGTMGAAATAPTEPESAPMAGAPTVGTCYKMGNLQTSASTNSSRSVDCYNNHTAMTYHVGLFPKGTKFADAKMAEKVCNRKLPEAVGVRKARMLGTIMKAKWFEPTASQWKAGGRWFRCDVVAEFNGKLKKLPDSTAPLFYDGVEDPWRRCVNSGGGTKDGDLVTCDKTHDYRWTGRFTLPKNQAYPAQKQVLDWSKTRCAKIVDSENWWVTWPGESQWSEGEHWVSCYANSSS
ncbi:MAG: septum formation family protein [Nocardioides sp.]|nr:septum formation family protein [Nocardioides sp.]